MNTQLTVDTDRQADQNAALDVLGQELHTQREKHQLTLDQIYAKTRINPKYITAMEAGQFADLPEAYTRLFLKNYALALHLDPDEVLAHYDGIVNAPEVEEETVEVEEPSKRSKKWMLVGAVVVLLGLGGAAAWFWLMPKEPDMLDAPLSEKGPQVAEAPVEPIYQTRVVGASSLPTHFVLNDNIADFNLVGRAIEETWVWVWADEEQVFKGLAKAGDEWTWQADRTLRIHIERPSAFSLTLGGQSVQLNVSPEHQVRIYASRFNLWREELAFEVGQ